MYQKTTLRKMTPTARKLAEEINQLERTTKRLKAMLHRIQFAEKCEAEMLGGNGPAPRQRMPTTSGKGFEVPNGDYRQMQIEAQTIRRFS